MIELSDPQVERFSRQIILPELGAARQQALVNSSATVICQGNAESLLAVYLAVAGVGRLRLVKPQKPAISDQPSLLWRDEPEVPGKPPARSSDQSAVKALLGKHNPATHVEIYPSTELSAALSVTGVALVLADSVAGELSSRCRSTGVPLLWGLTLGPTLLAGADLEDGPCWQCVSSAIAPAASEADANLALAAEGFLGSILAAEAIKLLAGLGTALLNRPLLFDARSMASRAAQASSRPGCQTCGDHRRED